MADRPADVRHVSVTPDPDTDMWPRRYLVGLTIAIPAENELDAVEWALSLVRDHT